MYLKRKAKRIHENIRVKAVSVLSPNKGFGYEMPPEKSTVEIYFDQKGFPEQASLFYNFYNQAKWSSRRGTPYRNWKLLASDWLFNYQQELKLENRLRANHLFTCGL